MSEQLTLPNHQTVYLGRIQAAAELVKVLASLGLTGPRPTLVLVGGASGLLTGETGRDNLIRFFHALARTAERTGAVVIDGGTDAGIMALMGQARTETGGTFPLLGVAAVGTINLDQTLGRTSANDHGAPLELHHTHFLLVPGNHWGDESPWISHTATALTGSARSVTVLVNGGLISRTDVAHSLDAGRPVLVVAGTGRLADELAADSTHSPLRHVIQLTTPPEEISRRVAAMLGK